MEPAPSSPLIGSDFCSLTSKSPIKVDHLVTFIACEFVTGRPGYENFRFAWLADRLRRLSGGGVHRPTIAALRYAEPPDPSIARADFRTNMAWYTGQKGTESCMTIEKCINEYGV